MSSMWRRIRLLAGSMNARILMAFLAWRHRVTATSLLGDANVVVSLASHGSRLMKVHLTIESIAKGKVRPRRMILWLDGTLDQHRIPAALQRLQRRGLEIRGSGGMYGPHTKYYPYVSSSPRSSLPLVTCDDDVLYPRWWLAKLLDAYSRQPQPTVIGYRAHRMTVQEGRLLAYDRWDPLRTTAPSVLNFVTGVSGAIYPPNMLRLLAELGPEFLELCPRADDVWLHVVALRSGIAPRIVDLPNRHFPLISGSQKNGLYLSNVISGGNDVQIRATYTANDLALLTGKANAASDISSLTK